MVILNDNKSLELEGLFAITLIYSSSHRFSIAFKTALMLVDPMLVISPVRANMLWRITFNLT